MSLLIGKNLLAFLSPQKNSEAITANSFALHTLSSLTLPSFLSSSLLRRARRA